jgi:RNA polymerase primary sigma factor
MKTVDKLNCRQRGNRLAKPAIRRILPRLPKHSRLYAAPKTVSLKPARVVSVPVEPEPRPVAEPASHSGSRGDTLQLYLREIGQVKLLTPEEEIILAKRIKRGDEKAREQMIKANLRLVVKIARDYENQGLPLLDLINEGNIGLMKGVERFNPAKGAKLSTYASLWIKQSIRRALSNQSKTIRLPDHVVDKVAHIRKAEIKLRELLGHDPGDEEIAEHLGLPVKRVKMYRDASRAPVSLDAPLGHEADDSDRVSEVVADPNAAAPFERLAKETDAELVREMFAVLTERERAILAMRFGLNDDTQKTLEEIGKHFGVTRERIRQIEAEALLKLRNKMRKREAMAEATN